MTHYAAGVRVETLLVSVKRTDPQLPPAEREALWRVATLIDAVPLVAVKPPRKAITFRRLTGPGPKDWRAWGVEGL